MRRRRKSCFFPWSEFLLVVNSSDCFEVNRRLCWKSLFGFRLGYFCRNFLSDWCDRNPFLKTCGATTRRMRRCSKRNDTDNELEKQNWRRRRRRRRFRRRRRLRKRCRRQDWEEKKVWKLKNRNLEESKNLWKSWEIKKPQDFVKKQTPKTHH